jgi:hypothetical protein
MEGQYSLFDNTPLSKKRMPSEYAFRRYIGQKVSSLGGKIHTIVGIDKYYSFFEDRTIGTPHDTLPVDPKERLEAHKTELEYQEYRFSREHDSISQRNIEILKGLIGKMEDCEK